MNKKILTLVIMTLSLTAMLITSGCIRRDGVDVSVNQNSENHTDKPSMVTKDSDGFFQINLYFTVKATSYDSSIRKVGKKDGMYVDRHYSKYKISTAFHKQKKNPTWQDDAPDAIRRTKEFSINLLGDSDICFLEKNNMYCSQSIVEINRKYSEKFAYCVPGYSVNDDGIIASWHKPFMYIANLPRSAKAWLNNLYNDVNYHNRFWLCPIEVRFQDSKARGLLGSLSKRVCFTLKDYVPIEIPKPGEEDKTIQRTYKLKVFTPILYILAHIWKITFRSGSTQGHIKIYNYRPIPVESSLWKYILIATTAVLVGVATGSVGAGVGVALGGILVSIISGSAANNKEYKPEHKFNKPSYKHFCTYNYNINEV